MTCTYFPPHLISVNAYRVKCRCSPLYCCCCCYGAITSTTTLSSEALMSCVGLTLSFHDARKLSRYLSLSFPISFLSPPDSQDMPQESKLRSVNLFLINVLCTPALSILRRYFSTQSMISQHPPQEPNFHCR